MTRVIFQVPVIAVFTKYDQFKRNIWMKLEDEGRDPVTDFDRVVEEVFDHFYLGALSGTQPFVRLESEDFLIISYPSQFLSCRNAQT